LLKKQVLKIFSLKIIYFAKMLTLKSAIRFCLYLNLLLIICCCNKTAEIKKVDEVKTFPKPPSQKVIVVLGSSTAYGIGANPIDSSWVNLLTQKFSRDNKKVTVINLALGGYTTYNILPDEYLANTSAIDTARNVTKALKFSPDLIIISLPTNDISNNYSDDEILSNYQKITNTFQPLKIPVLITSTQPRNFGEFEKRKRLKLFNDKLSTLYPLNILSTYDSLANSSYYIRPEYSHGDGIHVNNAGHKVIYEIVSNNITLLKTCGY
jgi:acyl-CoA thioesterase-1